MINVTHENRHPDTSPERRLIVAILQTVFDDLDDEDELTKFYAFEFLLAKKGTKADLRRELLSLIDLDDDFVQDRIGYLREIAPERPPASTRRSRTEGRASDQWLIDAWPNKPTTIPEIATITNLHPHTALQKVRGMIHRGELIRISRGRFVPAGWVDPHATT